MFRATRWFALAVSFAVALHGTAFAQTRPKDNRSGSECANAGVVTVISSTVSGTSLGIANDLSFVLDEGDDLRVLPIIGKGAQQNLHDILQLKGIDIAIVRSDGLEELKNNPEHKGAERDLASIVKLFNDEARRIARPDITDIRQLAGTSVNLDLQGSGANHSSANSSISSGIRTADLLEPETGFITVSASSSSRPAGSV